ncbi:helix-turn-helix domain-containing protein [Homoserinibacter sp. GY 40078]|uniref:helix-turn-helix domain-containing protein n=1 Tax=Homoserinibacter sp. GY 40078 TaxID=2603275 RepID=UPI0011CAFC51|nr:TetR/AcrR family transcriptional regulator [Homoserinibacter sp. GY 40078]TXK19761.1 helix-turn-helix transcriptional regulator [Homoserinibacter sp. GY 40078]
MGRWEPGSQQRLAAAALELYAEQGFDQTTVADIAARAGVTERTFFRHFGDKREVLFAGSAELEATFGEAMADAPDTDSAFAAAGRGARAIAAMLTDIDHSRRRARAIAADPSLQERELLKMAALHSAAAEALRGRGVPEFTAALVADAAVAAFARGFDAWIADGGVLSDHVDAALRTIADAVSG